MNRLTSMSILWIIVISRMVRIQVGMLADQNQGLSKLKQKLILICHNSQEKKVLRNKKLLLEN